MQRCIDLFQERNERRRRVERLKQTLDHSRGFLGADPQTFLSSWFQTRHEHATTGQSVSNTHASGRPDQTPRNRPPVLTPDLTGGKVSYTSAHSRKSSSSGAVPSARLREYSSTGAAMHAAHASADSLQEGSSMLDVARSPPIESASRRYSSVGMQAAATREDARTSEAGNMLRDDTSVQSPHETGAASLLLSTPSPWQITAFFGLQCPRHCFVCFVEYT
jgi:hypothetical protein